MSTTGYEDAQDWFTPPAAAHAPEAGLDESAEPSPGTSAPSSWRSRLAAAGLVGLGLVGGAAVSIWHGSGSSASTPAAATLPGGGTGTAGAPGGQGGPGQTGVGPQGSQGSQGGQGGQSVPGGTGGPGGAAPPGMSGQRLGPPMGTIAALTASQLTLKQTDGVTSTYSLTAQTRVVVDGSDGSLSDLTVGEQVVVLDGFGPGQRMQSTGDAVARLILAGSSATAGPPGGPQNGGQPPQGNGTNT